MDLNGSLQFAIQHATYILVQFLRTIRWRLSVLKMYLTARWADTMLGAGAGCLRTALVIKMLRLAAIAIDVVMYLAAAALLIIMATGFIYSIRSLTP